MGLDLTKPGVVTSNIVMCKRMFAYRGTLNEISENKELGELNRTHKAGDGVE